MEIKLHVIRAGDFIRTTPTGHLDLAASKRLFARIATAVAGWQEYGILIDLREVGSVKLSAFDIWELAEGLREHGTVFRRKTAVLLPKHSTGERAELLRLCAENRGFPVRPFRSFEEAVYWLAPAVWQGTAEVA